MPLVPSLFQTRLFLRLTKNHLIRGGSGDTSFKNLTQQVSLGEAFRAFDDCVRNLSRDQDGGDSGNFARVFQAVDDDGWWWHERGLEKRHNRENVSMKFNIRIRIRVREPFLSTYLRALERPDRDGDKQELGWSHIHCRGSLDAAVGFLDMELGD